MNSNQRKESYLGMPFGTAMGRLRKSIMFSLAQECGRDVCYRCGKKIFNERDFSIEHKIPWQGKDADLFWNISNIAFSHLGCNREAAHPRPRNQIHGTITSYRFYGCRCAKCRKVNAEYAKRYRDRIKLKMPDSSTG